MDKYRRLMVMGINKLVEENKISLLPSDNDNKQWGESGHLFTNLYGEPTLICWSNVGHDELRISVWWKYDHLRHPQANLTGNSCENFLGSKPLAKRQHYPKFVGVTVSGWLERKTGQHLQGKERERLFDIYTRKSEIASLENLPVPTPKGYRAEGKFFL